jgi:hypothetical protein
MRARAWWPQLFQQKKLELEQRAAERTRHHTHTQSLSHSLAMLSMSMLFYPSICLSVYLSAFLSISHLRTFFCARARVLVSIDKE